MPWSIKSPMDQKTQFIADYLRQSLPITELCRHYGISRKTAYKWISRYHEAGASGLQDRSRKPRSCPHQTEPDIVEALLDARRRHPTWGAKKLLKLLRKSDPGRSWPARATACDLLARHGLIKKPRKRRHLFHPGKPASIIAAPNQVWCADFKGQFKTRDGLYCYPLTITDGFSRYLLACQGRLPTAGADAKTIFTKVFRAYGLPERIRTDNGVPFATVSLARLSSLSAWWIRLGIVPELIEPGHPQPQRPPRTNASHAESGNHSATGSEPARESFADSTAFKKNIISSVHTRRSTWRRQHRYIKRAHGRTLRSCRSWNIRRTSRRATSATTAASAGTAIG